MKSRIEQVGCVVFAAGVTCVGLWALNATTSTVGARSWCVCANIYLPVICDNGRTYLNPCVADCAGATGCVPLWIVPPPIE